MCSTASSARSRRSSARWLRAEDGSSTVEFALVLPLLLMVLVGAVQFALVYHARTVAETAVVEGARLASAEGATLQGGAERTQAVLAAGLGDTGRAFSVTATDGGDAITAEAAGSYALFIPWVTTLAVPIHATAEMRKEGFRDGP